MDKNIKQSKTIQFSSTKVFFDWAKLPFLKTKISRVSSHVKVSTYIQCRKFDCDTPIFWA